MRTRHTFFRRHRRTIFALLFLVIFAGTISYATPPSSPYNPGETLDPNCAPGDSNCLVQIIPSQSGNNGKYLTTDGSSMTWSSVSAGGAWGSITGTLSNQTDLQNALDAKVAATRTITVNGVVQDLTADRVFTTEVPLTFSTGLTRSTNTVTNNLSTGVSGGQDVIGGTGAGETLNLVSTSNGAKGKIIFGASVYDEANNRLGVGTNNPGSALDVTGTVHVSTLTGTGNRLLQAGATGDIGASNVDPQQVTDVFVITGAQNTLISGGVVSWVSGLTFDISAADYYIQGDRYQAPATQVTLSPADTNFDRIDVFAVDVNGDVVVIEGTPSATPTEPEIDSTQYLRLSFAYIPAAATAPQNVTNEYIYQENIEWTTSTNQPAVVDFNYATAPHAGLKSVRFSQWLSGANATFIRSSSTTLTGTTLVFYIKTSAPWGSNSRKLSLQWLTGSTAASNSITMRDGNFGFSENNTGWQKIAIPISQWTLSSQTADRLRITIGNNTTASFSLQFDDLELQGGVTNTAPQQNTFLTVQGNSGSYSAQTTKDTLSVLGANSLSTSFSGSAVTVSLAGDTASPGNSQYYGTNGSGSKGWYTLPTQSTPTLQQVLTAGSTLTSSNTISSGTTTTEFNGSTTSSNGVLLVTNTSSSGTALKLVTSGGYAIRAETSGASSPASLVHLSSNTNSIISALDINAQTSGTAAAGIGTAIDMYTEVASGGSINSTRIASVYTDVGVSPTSKLEIYVQNAGTLAKRLMLAGSGQLSLSGYGAGTQSGTAAYNLAVDSSGNVIEVAAGGGGGTPTLQQVLTAGSTLTTPAGANAIASYINTDTDYSSYTESRLLSLQTNGTEIMSVHGNGSITIGKNIDTDWGGAGYASLVAWHDASIGEAANNELVLGVSSNPAWDNYAYLDTYGSTSDWYTYQSAGNNTDKTEFTVKTGYTDTYLILSYNGANLLGLSPTSNSGTPAYTFDTSVDHNVGNLFSVSDAGTSVFNIDYAGALKFGSYGSGTITGTAAYSLAVDSSGNVIEVAGGGGSQTLQQVLDSGSILTSNDHITTGANSFWIEPNSSNAGLYLSAGYSEIASASDGSWTNYGQVNASPTTGVRLEAGQGSAYHTLKVTSSAVQLLNQNGAADLNLLLTSLPASTTSNVLYYDNVTGAVSFGAAAGGGGGATPSLQDVITQDGSITGDKTITVTSGARLIENIGANSSFILDDTNSSSPAVLASLNDGIDTTLAYQYYPDGMSYVQSTLSNTQYFQFGANGLDFHSSMNGYLYGDGDEIGIGGLLYLDVGTPCAGCVLTDVNGDGYATWQPAAGGGGGTPTFQQVLTAGSTTTADNTINTTGHTFKIQNSGGDANQLQLKNTGTGYESYTSVNTSDLQLSSADINYDVQSVIEAAGNAGAIYLYVSDSPNSSRHNLYIYNDQIVLNKNNGSGVLALKLQNLPSTTTSDILYYDSSTGTVSYGAPSAGSTPTLDQVLTAGTALTNSYNITGGQVTFNGSGFASYLGNTGTQYSGIYNFGNHEVRLEAYSVTNGDQAMIRVNNSLTNDAGGFISLAVINSSFTQNHELRVNHNSIELSNAFDPVNLVITNGLAAESSSQSALCITSAGVVQQNTGAQTCTVSSARFKHDIEPLPMGALETIDQLVPSSFIYNGQTNIRIGLVAEAVNAIDPRLVFYEDDGVTPRGVRYEDLAALTVKGVQELNLKLNDIANFDDPTDDTFVNNLRAWLANATNHITRIFTGEICLTDPDGSSECLNKSELTELKQLIHSSPAQATPPENTDPTPSPAPTDTSTDAQTDQNTPTDTTGDTTTNTTVNTGGTPPITDTTGTSPDTVSEPDPEPQPEPISDPVVTADPSPTNETPAQ